MAESLLLEPDTLRPEPQLQSLLPAPDEGPITRVPRNVNEVAALITMAMDSPQFAKDYATNANALRAGHQDRLLSQIIEREALDTIAAAKQQAHAYAAARDTEGAAYASQVAAQLDTARPTAEDNPVLAQQVLATRALERLVSVDSLNQMYDRALDTATRLSGAAGDVAGRNIIAQEIERIGEPGLSDTLLMLGGSIIAPHGYDIVANRIISRAVGSSFVFDSHAARTALRDNMLGKTQAERAALIRKMVDSEEFGLFGDNKAAKVDFLRKLAEMTRDESRAEAAINALGVADVASMLSGLTRMFRKGTPLKAIADTAGPNTAGKLAATDLTTKQGITGLSDMELVGRVIASGRSPLEADPSMTAGLSAAAQEKLRGDWNTLLASVRSKLDTSGLSPDDIQKEAARIRATYMPETNKGVFDVQFGEASADGQSLTVFWQNPRSGRVFTSKEAAERWAREAGLDNWAAVPKNVVEEPVVVRNAMSPDEKILVDEWKGEVKDTVAALKKRLKDLDGELKYLEDNYSEFEGSALQDRFHIQTQRTIVSELIDNAKKVKSYSDAVEWDDYYQNFADSYPKNIPVGVSSEAATRTSKAGQHVIDTITASPEKATNAEVVLSALVKHGSADIQVLAKRLLDKKNVLDWKRVKVEWRQTSESTIGHYAPVEDAIAYNTKHALTDDALLHEVLHAHNSQVITLAVRDPKKAAKVLTKAQIKASNELRELQQRLKTHFEESDNIRKLKMGQVENLDRALEFPDELLAYGTTHSGVRDLLQSVKLRDLGYGENENVVSRLWKLFKEILGFEGNDTALAKLMESVDNLSKDVVEQQRSVVTRDIERNPKRVTHYRQIFEDRSLKTSRKSGPVDMKTALEKELVKVQRGLLKDNLPEETRQALLARAEQLNAEIAKMGTSGGGGWVVKQTRTDPLSYDAIGKFSDQDIKSMSFIAVDPKHGASELAVETRVVGVHGEAKVVRDLVSYIEPYYKGLSRVDKQKVEALLIEGDAFSNGGAMGKEFTFMEAVGKGLSDQAALAYLATRQLRMAMYHIRNGEMVRHMRAMGLREMEVAGIRTVGKELTVEQAGGHIGKLLYDATDQTTGTYTKLGMEDLYAKGKRIVRLEKPETIDGQLRQTFIADTKTVKAKDIHTALNYRPGEYSRIYTDEYFITMKKGVKVDGEMQEVVETIRTAPSAREAQDFAQNTRLAIEVLKNKGAAGLTEVEKLVGNYFDVGEFATAVQRGDFDGLKNIEFHFTRNREEYLNGSVNEALSQGRLFTSKRSERLFSTDRARENTLGVYESLEAEITNVSRVANINQWRETMVRRWMNTFGNFIPNRTGNDVADFYSATDAMFTKGSDEALFAERTHRYIMRQIGLRTQEERFYEQMTRRMTEKFFAGNEKVESVGAKIRQMSVLGFMRHINFNLTLGMFNPAQLIVQANGAATAIMLSPLHGAGAAKTFPLLRMALMSDREDVWKWFAKADKLSSLGLSSEEEFVKLVKAVRQTGIIDNIRSTSLYNLEDGKHNIFGGYSSKVLGGHAFFFNRGEEFSRLVSFDVARREFVRANPEVDWTSKSSLAAIVRRMDDLTQNMTKANLARFQEGALSIPLQFAQYNIKLAANIMTSLVGKGEGRGFTKREAVQLLAGHVLVYGAAGNGLMSLIEETMPEKVKESLTVEQKTYIAQGLVGGVVAQVGEWLTGERTNVALGSRLGSFNYYQELGNAIFNDPKNIYEVLMGPSLNSAKRLGTIGEVAALWYKDPELTGKDVLLGLGRMSTEQVASLRNVTKAYLWHTHNNKMLDRNNVAVALLSPNEVLAQALGFQPTAMVDVSNLIKSKKHHNEAIEDIANTIFKVQKDIIAARMRGDSKYADEQHKLLQVLWPENAGDFLEVQKRIRDRLYPYDNDFQKLLGDYMWKGQTYTQPLVTTQEPRK